MKNLKKQFEENGFLILSNFFSKQKTNKISKILHFYGNKNFDGIMNPDRSDFLLAQSTHLIEKQKIILGGSSGINIAGAIKLAKKMGPGKTIVTILCDHGKRYASKIFNKDFLKEKNLPIPKWL